MHPATLRGRCVSGRLARMRPSRWWILAFCVLACTERRSPSGNAPAASGNAPAAPDAPSAARAPVAPSSRAEAVPQAPAAGSGAEVAPLGSAAPVGGNWLRCYASFQPRTRPELDVTRLGLMCGPSNGMKQLSDVHESRLGDAGTEREHRWTAAAGDCFRIFAVGEGTVEDLDVEVVDARGRRVAHDTTDDRWPIVAPDGPFCVFEAGAYRARVRAQRGAGSYAIQIWRLR